jgi:hypothetical protein
MATTFPIQFLLSSVQAAGVVLAAGQVYFYSPGTTLMTGISVYTEPTDDIAHIASNPFTLDANGTAQLYIKGSVRIVIKSSDLVTKFDYDNLIFSDTGTFFKGDIADDTTLTLPTLTGGAMGIAVVGDDEQRTIFSAKSDGTVNLLMASSLVTFNADTDGYFCIGTSVASPVVIKNRLGASKKLALQLTYV